MRIDPDGVAREWADKGVIFCTLEQAAREHVAQSQSAMHFSSAQPPVRLFLFVATFSSESKMSLTKKPRTTIINNQHTNTSIPEQ